MVLLSTYYWQQYANSIWNDNKYPYRYESVNAYDKEWALATNEMKSWSSVTLGLNIMHGTGVLLWFLNMLFDGRGGDIHYLYYRFVQFSYFTPMVDMVLLANVIRSYVQSAEEENTDIAV